DVITSIQDAAGNVTGGNSIVNNVGSAIKNAGNAGDSFLTKLDAANTATPNAAVNVSDLKNTADGLTDKGLKFDANEGGIKTNKLGSTVTVQGSGALTAGKAYADEYNTANIRTNISQNNGDTVINVGLAKALKDINSISNGASSITLNSTPGGATNTPAVQITGGNLSMGDGTINNKIVNLAPGTADTDAVNVKQLKDTELHITPGTYTPGADKKVKLTYTDGNNTVVNGKEAVIDLSGLATGGTTSTEKVQKAADATGDKNIAEVGPKSGDTFGAANATYEVSVSRNAVKDAAREAVTVNNGGTTTGGTYTADTNNPISVTAVPDNTNHNTTYAVTFDGNKAAKQIPLTYKATNGTITTADQTVKLDKGLNFTGGDYTTASVGADGKVTFDVTLGTAPTVTDGKPGVPGQAGAAGKDGIATVKTVVDTINNSGWKANAKANGGTLVGNSTATVVKPGDQVNFAAGKNLTVKQDLTGEHTYTYSLNKDLKDLTSVEIGGSTIKTDGDHITITSPDTNPGATPGATVTNKVANLGDEKHIKPDTYAVANDGSVTLKYVDGNGKDLTETTKITGIAKKAKVINGKNTTVEEGTDAVDNSTTYKVNVKGDLTGISSITNDGTNNGKISFGPNKTVTVDGDHSITLNASTGKIGGLQNLTFDPTNFTSGQAATEDQLKSVHDTLKANERHIAPTTVATGSTETKGGTANAGGTANVYKYDAASKTVTLTYNDGNGHAVTDTKAVIDFSALNTGGTTASTWTAKTSAENTTAGSEVGKHAGDTSQVIGNQNSVDFQAGKNMTVKQTNDGNGNTTINYALDKNLDVESVHVGKDGKDGKIGIDGKDGVDGLDGTNRVDIHVEKGAKGVDGTDGHDGVNGHNGKDGMTRIVYEDKGGKQEVATLNDGLKFTGNNESTVNNHKLNTLVKVQGEGTKESTVVDPATGKKYVVLSDGTTKFESAKDNIAVEADGTDTLTVKLNKNLKGLNSIQLGGNTIQSNGDNITFTTNGGTTKTVATTDQLWTIQANGTDVPAKSGKVNLVAGDHITITPDAANGKMTISATGFGSMDGFNVKTSAESATVGTHAGDTTENIKNGKTVDMQAGKNLVVTQTNDGNGNTTVNYALNKDVDLGTNGSLKAGDTTVNKDGVTIANGPSITKTGVDAGDKKITNVADGAVNATSKDAVNGSQLKKYTDAAKTTVEAGDDNVKVETDNSAADGHTNYKVSLKPVVEIGDTHKVKIDGHTGDITGLTNVNLTDPTFATKGRAATEEQLKQVLTEAKNKAIEKVQAGTAAAGDTNIATVAPKAGDTFGTAGATYEVSVSKNAVKDAAKEAVKVTSVSPAITVTADTSVAHETTYKVGFDGNQAATQIPLTYKQNGGNTRTVKLSDGLNFIDGTNTKARTAADGKVTFDVMGDLTGITSISNAAGGPKMTFGGNSINVTNGDLNMGGNKITKLGKGTAKDDAATVGQLTKVTSNNHSVVVTKTTDADGAPVYDLAVTGTPGAPAADPRVDMLGEEIGRVGAQGAALSALKPIQYDPLEPTQIMAGYGNYRGNSAVALGVAHYKNESTLIHGGVSWAGGSSHMMANAGVTWKVGNRDSEAAVADRYRKGPISSAYAMQQEMAAMKAQNAGLKGEVSDLKAENEQMKAQIAAMMAKLGL
ncbi:MAG: YadA-like family protein, partial [Veillonella sp.]|nr:YadA-like family protein [Veillonella sp.]